MKFKNYKELCDFLGWEYLSGNSKIAQLNKLKRNCEFVRVKQSLIIQEVFDSEEKSNDKRHHGNRSKKARYLRYLILVMICKNHDETGVVAFNKGQMYRELGIVNDNYHLTQSKRNILREYLGVTNEAINEAINTISDNIRRYLMHNIKKLSENSGAYKYYNSYTIVIEDKYIAVTKEQHKIIKKVEQYIMCTMGAKHKSEIVARGCWVEFREKVTYILCTKHFELFEGVNYYFESIHFIYELEKVERLMSEYEFEEGFSYEEALFEINRLVNESLDEVITKRHNNSFGKIGFGNYEGKNLIEYRIQEKYIEEQKKIKNILQSADSMELIC